MAEYRQRKAHADSQRKQKKKKKKKSAEDSEGDSQDRVEVEPDQSVEGEKGSSGRRDGSRGGSKDPPTTEFTFARTLRSGETVKHDQTYTIEVDAQSFFSHVISSRGGVLKHWHIQSISLIMSMYPQHKTYKLTVKLSSFQFTVQNPINEARKHIHKL